MLRPGDQVHVTLDGQSATAVVLFASQNGRSLMLQFDALLGGYLGLMPVLRGADGQFRDLIRSEVVTLVPDA